MLVATQEVTMRKKYIVSLSDAERAQLRTLIRKGTASARTITRAPVLLLADEGYSDAHIAASVHVGTTTVERRRRRWVADGLPAAVHERPRPGGQRRLDGKQEAPLVARACSEPPEERPRWTMHLLADRLVAIGAVDAISDETVRWVLKKTSSNPG